MPITHTRLLHAAARRAFLASSFACALALAGCASMTGSAEISASLSSAAEVPTNTSAATGSLQGRYDRSTRQLSWKLFYSGLSGPATMAHFHGPAMPGQNAGVALGISNFASASEGKATLNDAQAADLLAGKWYVNVHTAAHPGGEIRGQVMVR